MSVCHRTGSGKYNLLNIAASAIPAHHAHGDAAPGASVPNVPGSIFDAGCQPQRLPFTGTWSGRATCCLANPSLVGTTYVLVQEGSIATGIKDPVPEPPGPTTAQVTGTVSPDGSTVEFTTSTTSAGFTYAGTFVLNPDGTLGLTITRSDGLTLTFVLHRQ